MIKDSDAKKVWKSDTPVIRKGDKAWRSDHPDRFGESAGFNPMSPVRFKKVEGYDERVGYHPTRDGELAQLVEGSDIIVVRAAAGTDGGLFWRHRYRIRNGAHSRG